MKLPVIATVRTHRIADASVHGSTQAPTGCATHAASRVNAEANEPSPRRS